MSGFGVEVQGPQPAEWEQLARDARRALTLALRLSLEATRDQVRRDAPRGESGDLGRSWRLVEINELTYQLVSDAPHAPFVSEGTRSHVIEARGSVLAFEIAGQEVFARRVEHPGTEPNPYVENAFAAMEGRRDQFVSRALREVFGV